MKVVRKHIKKMKSNQIRKELAKLGDTDEADFGRKFAKKELVSHLFAQSPRWMEKNPELVSLVSMSKMLRPVPALVSSSRVYAMTSARGV